MTSFIFDVVEAAEAERLVNNGIKWKGIMRRVSILRKGEAPRQNMTITKKVWV